MKHTQVTLLRPVLTLICILQLSMTTSGRVVTCIGSKGLTISVIVFNVAFTKLQLYRGS